eukprot:SAG11_NODE_10546_length_823_cov_0.683702_2_plen_157_part_00
MEIATLNASHNYLCQILALPLPYRNHVLNFDRALVAYNLVGHPKQICGTIVECWKRLRTISDESSPPGEPLAIMAHAPAWRTCASSRVIVSLSRRIHCFCQQPQMHATMLPSRLYATAQPDMSRTAADLPFHLHNEVKQVGGSSAQVKVSLTKLTA